MCAVRALSSLTALDLSSNIFDSDLECIQGLTKLKTLFLQSNKLKGTINTVLSPLLSLEQVDLSYNDVSGIGCRSLVCILFFFLVPDHYIRSQPHMFCDALSSVTLSVFARTLSLNYLQCFLTGDFSGLSTLTNLTWLSVCCGNNLVVSPLVHLQNLTLLNTVWLGGGPTITGDLVPLTSMPLLRQLYISSPLSGTLNPLTGKTALHTVYCEGCALSGTLDMFSGLVNLKRIGLASNNLSGNIVTLCRLTRLTELDVSTNQLLLGAQVSLSTLATVCAAANQTVVDCAPLAATQFSVVTRYVVRPAPVSCWHQQWMLGWCSFL
jgi:hypothetical protein